MVTYEYCCPNCDTFTADFPRGQQPDQLACPVCGVMSRRVFSVAGIHYRCLGFTKARVDPFRTNSGQKPNYPVMEERAMETAHKDKKAGIREAD